MLDFIRYAFTVYLSWVVLCIFWFFFELVTQDPFAAMFAPERLFDPITLGCIKKDD